MGTLRFGIARLRLVGMSKPPKISPPGVLPVSGAVYPRPSEHQRKGTAFRRSQYSHFTQKRKVSNLASSLKPR